MNLRPFLRTLGTTALLHVTLASAWLTAHSNAGEIEFNRDVRPILSDNCFFCHGNDPKHRQADLRLDQRESAIELGAIAPGEPAKSSLIDRIHASDPDTIMPPRDSHKTLSDKQKRVLRQWIAEGASYQQHWSFEKPVKANVPQNKNPIDYLVQQRLSQIGLSPSPEADRRTLARRLFFDLIGLPPTPAQVREFQNNTSSDAYERLVDDLLSSEHFGERMAVSWLDIVRYADTIGYHSDTPRNVWPYRDWVIRSFNSNKPFDQFTIEQLAGDLLPQATQETRIGSAFNRLLLTTEEGGAQAKDYEQRMLTDRVRAVGATWLGQTTGCAQCHDHKFDPFTMRDFYSLGAFFADIEELSIGKREDGMVVASPEELQRLQELDTNLEQARKVIEKIKPELTAAQKQWEADVQRYAVALPELSPDASADAKAVQMAKAAAASLAKASKNRKPADLNAIRDYFLAYATNLYQKERDGLAKAQAARDAFYQPLAKCLVSVSTSKKRVVRILPRGNWMDESGETVEPAFPKYLAPSTNVDRPLNRLDLANWLVAKDNPLTARTVMNRVWKQFFGTGLSKVLDDLGAQGEPPPNPQLLDWLACEFVDSGWDMKRMIKLIVMSQTYRQVSTATPNLFTADPFNRELARQSPFRLDAEFVRDNALAVSGLLVTQIGGPSVKPYQPDDYWENLNFPRRTYEADQGASQYRRGLYTWWQRSFLHPSLLAFDAPNREECSAERNRSNIPQQALVLLNDPSYVEASRALATRILQEAPSSTDDRLIWAWQIVQQRDPTRQEMDALTKVLEERYAHYRRDLKAVDALLGIGFSDMPMEIERVDVAAWLHVARILLNLHETITRS